MWSEMSAIPLMQEHITLHTCPSVVVVGASMCNFPHMTVTSYIIIIRM